MTAETLLPCRSLSEPCRIVGAVGLSDCQTVGVCERRFPHSEPFAALCWLSDIDVLGLELHLSRSAGAAHKHTASHHVPCKEEHQAATPGTSTQPAIISTCVALMMAGCVLVPDSSCTMHPSTPGGAAHKHTASHHSCKKSTEPQLERHLRCGA